jgi:solute carrier family 25 S-adenosylmethionine transporter 26
MGRAARRRRLTPPTPPPHPPTPAPQVGGNLLGEMAAAVRKGGPGALYWGFLPYLLESFPYDITELATYFQLRDSYEAAAAGRSRLAGLAGALPPHAWDLAMGATAGAAAVLVSMPFDCIKTVIQTRGGEAALSPGVWGQARAFAATGAALVRRAGPGALFVGVVPRLVQQVPSSTICWWSIEACKGALAPWTEAQAQAGGGGGAAAA